MNRIEHVWDALGRRVAARQPPPQTLQELERALLEEWDRIPQLVINSLIDSMPQSSCKICDMRYRAVLLKSTIFDKYLGRCPSDLSLFSAFFFVKQMSDSPENVVYTSELSPSSMTSATTLLTPSLVSFASSLPTTTTSQRVVGSKPSFTSSSSSVTPSSNLTQTNSSIPSAGFTTILTTGGTKNQTALATSDSSSSQNSISLVPGSSPNLSVVPGSVVLPQTILQTNNSALLYHTSQGIVYATSANLPESVLLNLGQDQGGSQQQFITIPVSLSLTPSQQQVVQGVSNQSSTFTSASSSSSRREKTRK
ncbi:serum response factor [Trichonephila clavipes]|nr:serum response factor [Trichonephila clavipes]